MRVKNKKLVVVLGMHRSGTSAVTKSLEQLGVNLGSTLYPAGFDNPKGFWEDVTCLKINEELLRYLGSAYNQLDTAWQSIDFSDEYILQLKKSATQYIMSQLEIFDVWGFKDPRTCRLLSFWKVVFSELICEVHYVLVIRNPLSVAISLKKRNNIAHEKSYYLWLQHTLASLCDTQDCKRVLIDYDSFLDDPYSALQKIASHIKLAAPQEASAEYQSFKKNFLDNNLRHSRFTEKDVANVVNGFQLLIETYSTVLEISQSSNNLNNLIKSNNKVLVLNAELQTHNHAIKLINNLENELNRKDIALEALTKEINLRNNEIEQLKLENHKILTSTSWWLTKPLRLIKTRLIE